MKDHLAAEGAALESIVEWTPGNPSLNFRDLDNHLLELTSPRYWQAVAAQSQPDSMASTISGDPD